MKKILLIGVVNFIFTTMLLADKTIEYIKEFDSLKTYQIQTLKMIMNMAEKDNLSYTAGAIAWKETKLGRWQININSDLSMDCGLFGNNTKSVLNREDIKLSSYNYKEICTDLILDVEYAYTQFKAEISLWKHIHEEDWLKTWGSYNSGHNPNMEYAQEIKDIISAIHLLKKRNKI